MRKKNNKVLYQDKFTTIIELTSPKYKNQKCVIDTDDYDKIKKYNWSIHKGLKDKCFYAISHDKINGKYTTIKLHRLIMNVESHKNVDHKDFNGLNNVKTNLRICTPTENMRNRRMSYNNKSGYKGVCPVGNSKKWRMQIRVNKKTIYLGQCENPIDGAKIYDKAEIKYFGEFANINGV